MTSSWSLILQLSQWCTVQHTQHNSFTLTLYLTYTFFCFKVFFSDVQCRRRFLASSLVMKGVRCHHLWPWRQQSELYLLLQVSACALLLLASIMKSSASCNEIQKLSRSDILKLKLTILFFFVWNRVGLAALLPTLSSVVYQELLIRRSNRHD